MSSNPKRVVLLALKTAVKSASIPDSLINALKAKFPQLEFNAVAFHPSQLQGIEEAEILYAFAITPQIIAAAPKLKWFHSIVTGPDVYPQDELKQRGITATSPRGVYATPVAETVLGFMLAHTRKIRDCILFQKEKRWAALDIYNSITPAGELFESTVVIIGMGGIGKAVAQRCRAFGMKTIGVIADGSPKDASAKVDRTIFQSELSSVLKDADFVVLSCPLTAKTRGIIGSRELATMKPTSFLINVARGGLLDESALVAALECNQIAGAASDVFSTEPLPEGHPLFDATNMIITPHISGLSSLFWKRSINRFAKNLTLYLEGKPLLGTVDFKKGY